MSTRRPLRPAKRLVRWGLDGTLTVLAAALPRIQHGAGHRRQPRAVHATKTHRSTGSRCMRAAILCCSNRWGLRPIKSSASGTCDRQDRLVFTNPPDAGDLLCVGNDARTWRCWPALSTPTRTARASNSTAFTSARSETLYDYVSAAPSATYTGTNGYRLVGPQGAPGWFAAQMQSPAARWRFDLCLFDAATGEAAGRFSDFVYQGYVLTHRWLCSATGCCAPTGTIAASSSCLYRWTPCAAATRPPFPPAPCR